MIVFGSRDTKSGCCHHAVRTRPGRTTNATSTIAFAGVPPIDRRCRQAMGIFEKLFGSKKKTTMEDVDAAPPVPASAPPPTKASPPAKASPPPKANPPPAAQAKVVAAPASSPAIPLPGKAKAAVPAGGGGAVAVAAQKPASAKMPPPVA